MRRGARTSLAAACVALALASPGCRRGGPGGREQEAPSPPPSRERVSFGVLGEVTVLAPAGAPREVVLLAVGAAGLDPDAEALVAELTRRGALVAVISAPQTLARLARSDADCDYPAGDFVNLSNYLQMRRRLPEHLDPALVGIDAGASLVYAVTAQAPAHLFQSLVTVGFCPELSLARPLCYGPSHGLRERHGHEIFEPTHAVAIPWRAVQGSADAVCPPASIERYVRAAQKGELVTLDGLAHVPSGTRWIDEVAGAIGALAPPPPPAAPGPISDLPVVEVPAAGPARPELAFVISGDGGWADIDREVAGALAKAGISTVGLNALRYFWKGRTPDGTAADVSRILRHYESAWGKKGLVLIGYSRGADILPAVFDRLPPDLQARTLVLCLLGPATTASYEFHLGDWIGGSGGPTIPTLPDIDRIRRTPILCFYGADETDTACPRSQGSNVVRIEVSGGHHFNGDYLGIARRILAELGRIEGSTTQR